MSDDFGISPELYQAAIHELRVSIAKEIEKLLTRIFFNPEIPSLYRDYPNEFDYKIFEQKVLSALEEEERKEVPKDGLKLPYVFRVLSEELHAVSQDNSSKEKENISSRVIRLLMSPDYLPPVEWVDIFTHLGVLYGIWNVSIKNPEPFTELILLFSFCKLMGASHELSANYTMKGERELTRTKRTSKTIKAKSSEKKNWVFKIYSTSSKINVGMKLHTVAQTIEKEFKKLQGIGTIPRHIKTPGIHQIKNYLSNNDKIRNDFEQKGRYLIKKM